MLQNTYASILPIVLTAAGTVLLFCGIIMVTLQLKPFRKTNERRPHEKKLLIAGIGSIIFGFILIMAFLD
jgi:hypothetical protein